MNVSFTPGQRKMTNLSPLTEKQIRDAQRDHVYIFSVCPRVLSGTALNKTWFIPACAPDQEVSEPLVIDGVEYITNVRSGEGLTREYEWIGTDGIDVARDIIGTAPFKDASENLTGMGVFLSMTLVPAQADVEKARAAWLARCDEKVRQADMAYTVNGGNVQINGTTVSNIGRDAIEAVKVLGLQRPWADRNMRLELCDECGTGNLPTAAFCKQCDNMLNAEAAKRKFPAKHAERMGVDEPARRGPGRPRNEVIA